MTPPDIVFDDAGDEYFLTFSTKGGIKVKGPNEDVAQMIALFVRQEEEDYSPAKGSRVVYIARQVASRTKMKIKLTRRAKHEKGAVY